MFFFPYCFYLFLFVCLFVTYPCISSFFSTLLTLLSLRSSLMEQMKHHSTLPQFLKLVVVYVAYFIFNNCICWDLSASQKERFSQHLISGWWVARLLGISLWSGTITSVSQSRWSSGVSWATVPKLRAQALLATRTRLSTDIRYVAATKGSSPDIKMGTSHM